MDVTLPQYVLLLLTVFVISGINVQIDSELCLSPMLLPSKMFFTVAHCQKD